ncbi:MAG: rhodanese-like domain-containing protein [Cyanobacteriota bacterium]|nr:rhodanese-like domain-containing protein [Cyanobacteriota bacterium]
MTMEPRQAQGIPGWRVVSPLVMGIVVMGWLANPVGGQALPGLVAQAPVPLEDETELTQTWVVTPEQAKILIEQGATLLDVRHPRLQALGMLAGSVPAAWADFTQTQDPHRGKLLTDDPGLTSRLQALGVFQNQPVVVVADPANGWGEDGRMVWMLRTLGHRQAVMVDGGYAALLVAGVPLAKSPFTPARGDFVVQRDPSWEISRDQLKSQLVKSQLGQQQVVVIDTREAEEYQGEIRYGEKRGGHIPGAIHLSFRELIGTDGRMLSEAAIRAKLARLGISPEAKIINYCTAGIRSGWMTAVLAHFGFHTQNYAGSISEWAASPPEDFPMEQD